MECFIKGIGILLEIISLGVYIAVPKVGYRHTNKSVFCGYQNSFNFDEKYSF